VSYDSWEEFEGKGHRKYQVKTDLLKFWRWLRHKTKPEPEYEWRYEHMLPGCNCPVDRDKPLCPVCFGKLVYKPKKERNQ